MTIRPVLFSSRVRALLLTCTLLPTSLLSACGRSAEPLTRPAAEAPASSREEPEERAPETLEQAEAELERARLALSEVAGVPSPSPAAVATAPAAPSPPPAKAGSQEKRRAEAADDGQPSAGSLSAAPQQPAPTSRAEADSAATRHENACDMTCKAFSSLLRAKDAVCRLDVPNGARCARAEGIVRDATPRIQGCRCAP